MLLDFVGGTFRRLIGRVFLVVLIVAAIGGYQWYRDLSGYSKTVVHAVGATLGIEIVCLAIVGVFIGRRRKSAQQIRAREQAEAVRLDVQRTVSAMRSLDAKIDAVDRGLLVWLPEDAESRAYIADYRATKAKHEAQLQDVHLEAVRVNALLDSIARDRSKQFETPDHPSPLPPRND